MTEDCTRMLKRMARIAVATTALVALHAAVAADKPAASDWTLASKDHAGWRFADIGDITATNVANLKVAFTFSTGVLRGHEAAPLVVGDTMYIVTPYPNIVYALDLTKPGAPVKWQFEPKPLAAAQGVACCDVVNRGAAYADGRVFFNTLDNQTIALDARHGQGAVAHAASATSRTARR